MPTYIIAYLATGITFCVLDFVWLTIIARDFYRTRLGDLMLDEPKMLPAVTFYVLYILGLVVFAVVPGLRTQSILVAAGLGALLGLVAYACYDLTNLTTLKGWSMSLSLVDITWGIFVSCVATAVGFWSVNFFGKA